MVDQYGLPIFSISERQVEEIKKIQKSLAEKIKGALESNRKLRLNDLLHDDTI